MLVCIDKIYLRADAQADRALLARAHQGIDRWKSLTDDEQEAIYRQWQRD